MINTNNTKLSFLMEIFFIMGFTLIFYQNNAYILYGVIPLFLFFSKRFVKKDFFVIFLFISLAIFYSYIHGISASIRVLKTLVVFLPFFFTKWLRQDNFKLSLLFNYFMKINAIFVCIDFFLFLAVGKTIFRSEVSGFMPRTCGMFEDSNFFSYTMIIFIYYTKWKYGKYNKLCILSLLLSGSFSAIFMFLLLYLIFKIEISQTNGTKLRNSIFCFTAIGIITYDLIAIHSDEILDYLFSFQWNDLLKVKMYSISHRFTGIANAFSDFDEIKNILFGLGPGRTRSLSDTGLNLHNSLLQIILEMGVLLFSFVLFVIMSMISRIVDIRFVILFCAILFLSSIMETIYSPMLSFVYFLSLANYENT